MSLPVIANKSYCSLEEAKQFFSENELSILTNKYSDEGISAFNRSLASASSEINFYLAKVVRTPLYLEYEFLPEIIKEWTATIAVYKRSEQLDRYTNERRVRYEDIIAMLKDIAKGNANLPDEGKWPDDGGGGEPIDENGKNLTYLESEPRVFTRRKMWGL